VNRSTLARRYAPLAAALAVQLVIIVLAPSTSQKGTALASGSGANGFAASGEPGGDSGAAGGAGGAAGGVGGIGGASGGAGGAAGTAAGRGGGALPPGVASGDTSHCVGGRQYDPGLAYWAPPCVPGAPGAPFPNNGGSTGPGVTGDSITMVDYVTNYGAEVNAILQAQGQLVTADDAKPFDAAMSNFINKRYTLYGRKFKIVTYQSPCQAVPPDVRCLTQDIDKVIDQYKPYAFFWNTTLCSACFAEIARKGVVALGGDGFSDKFGNDLKPYFYSGGESATRVETGFAEWWCKNMTSVGTGRKAKYALPNNPAQNFNGQPRRLGVISTNDPDNEDTVKQVLAPALAKCGDKIWHTYFYDQNINTAAQQVEAGISAMDTPQDPASVVLCLCDSVAPAFLYQGEMNHNYYPENVIASDQQMDYDTAGQSYTSTNGQPVLACPNPSRGCVYDMAFGLSIEESPEPQGGDVGVRVIKDGGGAGAPGHMTPIVASQWARHYSMLANFMEAAGPRLTPANMQAASVGLPAVGGGGSGKTLLQVAPGDWYWMQDTRVVYFDKHKASPYNGQPGTYVQIGPRYNLGQFPSAPDGPDLPIGGRT
jgi:hypothetical protein